MSNFLFQRRLAIIGISDNARRGACSRLFCSLWSRIRLHGTALAWMLLFSNQAWSQIVCAPEQINTVQTQCAQSAQSNQTATNNCIASYGSKNCWSFATTWGEVRYRPQSVGCFGDSYKPSVLGGSYVSWFIYEQLCSEQLTISLAGLGGEVAPNATRAAHATVLKSDGSAKSGAAVSLALTVVPEVAGALPVTYTGTLSTYAGTTGADGRLPFEFRAPAAGGTHTIAATCTNCTNTATGTIRVPGCPVKDLPPITDPEVQLFEDNPDRSDETRLTPRMKTELACLKTAAAAGSPNVGSAYRPPAYNQHLIDVWKKWAELEDNEETACAALKTKIQGHFKTHKLKETQQPVPGSRHTVGEAVDVTISLPPATIDAFWPGCRLYRPPSLRTSDPVHFIYR